jgi:hypothetical protein
MSNYVKTTNFTSKDSLASGNPLKIVKGAEFDVEFNAIATAISSKADSQSPTFTGTPVAPTASAGNNSTQIATTAYADAAVAALPNYLDTTRIDVASASTINLTTSAPNTRHINITGTTTITGFTVAAGKTYFVRFDNSLTITNGASLVTQLGRNIITVAGDTCILRATAANTVELLEYVPVTPDKQIQNITASVGSSALTATLNPTRLDFRSATLSSGTINTRYVQTAVSVTAPNGATLGTTNGVASKLAVLAIDNSGTVEVAIVNTAGTVNLDESTLISTTAIDTAADSADVVYSTTARTNVPFRVVGYITSTQATAGAWTTSPSNIAGAFQGMTKGATAATSSINSGAVQATTSGTSFDFTSIPSWVKRITVMLNGVSTSGSSQLVVQIGSGSITSSGYSSTAVGMSTGSLSALTSSTGFVLEDAGSSSYALFGNLVLTNVSGNNWTTTGMFIRSQSSGFTSQTVGFVSLSGTLDRVRLTTANGTDTFDAGAVNILYE